MIKISNEFLTVNIKETGAEVWEVINNETKQNYMWEQDSKIWGNVSTVLFPIVGKVNNDEIKYKNKKYKMGGHGFARHAKFSHIMHSDSEVEMILTSDMLPENTFPFEFEFCIFYKLDGKSLLTTYVVNNPSDSNIYFSLGAHPGFKCPFDDKHKFEDYYLEFEDDTVLTKHEVTPEAFYTGKTSEYKLENGIIDLATNDVSETFVFSNYKSKFVSLVEKNSDRAITVSLKDFPLVGFWKKPNANFICIEPWCGKADDVGFDGDFDKKKDIIKLEPNKPDFEITYTTDFEY